VEVDYHAAILHPKPLRNSKRERSASQRVKNRKARALRAHLLTRLVTAPLTPVTDIVLLTQGGVNN